MFNVYNFPLCTVTKNRAPIAGHARSPLLRLTSAMLPYPWEESTLALGPFILRPQADTLTQQAQRAL